VIRLRNLRPGALGAAHAGNIHPVWSLPDSRQRVAVVMVSLGLTAFAAACGEANDGSADAGPGSVSVSASPTPDLPNWPACADVWVAGEKLAMGYKGCIDGVDAVKQHRYECSFGLPIIVFDDQFYAVAGSQINQVDSLEMSHKFQRALSSCQG
jgi:hypothetical protein